MSLLPREVFTAMLAGTSCGDPPIMTSSTPTNIFGIKIFSNLSQSDLECLGFCEEAVTFNAYVIHTIYIITLLKHVVNAKLKVTSTNSSLDIENWCNLFGYDQQVYNCCIALALVDVSMF